jgi:diguanylate cyclase (GGDEF)-like protein
MGTPVSDVASAGVRRSRRGPAWAATTALLAVLGIAASVLGAQAVARDEADESRKTLQSAAANVASTLELAIQHDDDMAVDAGAFLSDPATTQAQFVAWTDAARTLARYPEMFSIGSIVLVPHPDLPAFAARAEADPAGTLAEDGSFTLSPPGDRPFYCLAGAGMARPSVTPIPAGRDYCADPLVSAVLLAARDSGAGNYQPYEAEGVTWLAIQTPIYRGGGVPDSVDERRASFAGWVGTQIDPDILLRRALEGQSGLAVALRYRAGLGDVTFTRGATSDADESTTIDLDNGWTVEVSGSIGKHGITSGTALLLLLSGIAVSVLLGLLMYVLGTGRERARRQLAQRTGELHHQALHDALTGLPNRALVMDRIEQLLARDRRHDTSGALLFLDLDDFKNVNDTLGHGAGDRLLIAVAERLSGTLRGVDTIGRMGGDEFVVLVDGSSLDVAPELVAQRLLDVMRQPFDLDEALLPLTVNISIGLATGDRASADDLLRDADVALYQAKASGKNRYAVFDPAMQTDMSRRSDLEFELRSALTGGQYRLVYQPIYDLGELTIVGVEALLRWDHPVRGLIGPDEFIPILEQTGQIREVGRWVLHQACRQMAEWHSRGDSLDVSVNISARQLDSDSITEDIRLALEVSGLPASALIIEVTETALMDNVASTARRLQTIKDLGVRIAVDDFGTGYSSLAYLQQFPVDCLKIDRAFTSAVTTSPESRALVNTLVQLGKDLGLSTLAEGVETTAEMDILRRADVDQAQGFLMSRPLDPDTLEAQLLAPRRSRAPVSQLHP